MTHYPLEKNISGVVFIGNKGNKLLSTQNNFVYDSGNNRLGINTGTPLYTLDVNGTGNFIAIRFPDGTIQSTAGAGSGFNYYDFNLAVGNESSTVISSGETISFTGFGNTVVTRVGNAIRISGLDTNTTYIAGTGLNLIGTTFNVSGSTTSNSGIVQLQDSIQDNITNRAVTPNAVFDYVGSVSGAINTRLATTGSDLLSRINTLSGNLITTGSNLQSQISSVSGLLYNFWTLNVTGSNDQITRQQTVTFTGTGATSVEYNSSTNTVTISSTDTNTTYTANSGIQLVGTTFRTFGTGFFNGINLSGSIGNTTNNLYNSGGQLYFNGYPYVYLPTGGLEGQILYKVTDTGNDLAWIDNYATEVRELVKNDTGSGILKGTAVMAVGAVGDRIRVAPAIANGSIEARYMFGITSEDINNGDEGYVTLVGPIKGLVTSGYPIGTVLWLDPNIPGALTSGQPSSPNLQMSVAIVTNSHPSNGRIFVRMWEQQPGLHELHDVDVDVNLQHGDLISYNTGNSTWVNIPNFSGILQSQINSVSGLLYNYWTLNVTGSNDQITKEQTVTFTGGGATSVTYNSATNTITISSTDNNTTYSAGTGLNLVGTTFNVSGSTTSNPGIVQLQDSVQSGITNRALTPNAAFTYVGSVSGAIDTRIIATGSNLQSQINSASGDLSNRLVSTGNNLQGQINSVSGLLYNHWTLIAPGAAADNITRQQSVTFTGTGATSVSYNTGTNVLTITSTDTNTTYSAGTGLNLVGTTFNVSGATTSSAGIIQLQDTIQDGITNRATTPNAVFDYVASVSGVIDTRIISTGNNLQGQISANDADIATLSGLINSVSGTTLGTASGVAFFSNAGTITGSPNFTYSSGTATLNINGTLTAISKSFLIDHPTKPDKKLQYSSLESPYHGVRLTGRNRLKNNTCTIQLPEYIYNLVKEEGINIQITNIRHSQIIYVESIDALNNRFTVACDNVDYYHEYEFFWTFTGIRKDIDDLEVEV